MTQEQGESLDRDEAELLTTEVEEKAKAAAVWIESLPLNLQPVVRRYGRNLFEFTVNAAQATEDLTAMAQLIRSRDAQIRINRLAQTLNNIAAVCLIEAGWTRELHQECKRELDEAIVGLVVPQEGSRIILPH